MVIEADMVIMCSSYGWATTRDWSKFGLLYLHKGKNGEQILEESWVKYVQPHRNVRGAYGAQFWLNAGGKFPDAPRDMFYCSVFKDRW
jgi:CubicO group peptidase (beta-lactamase class C family)